MKRAFFGLLVGPALILAVACGGSSTSTGVTEGTDGGADAAATDGAKTDSATLEDGATDGGTDLFLPDTTKIVLTVKGGFGPGPLDGSTCTPADLTYTLTLPARELSWKLCELADGGSYAFRTGQRTLSAEEYAPVSAALHALQRATQTACGADAPNEEIVLTTPSGDTTYYDDFYFCNASDPKIYVTNLSAVRAELDKLAK